MVINWSIEFEQLDRCRRVRGARPSQRKEAAMPKGTSARSRRLGRGDGERNLELYSITIGENSNYKVPYLAYRGTPTGIDIFKVIETGITPAMDVGIAGRDGGQIGAG